MIKKLILTLAITLPATVFAQQCPANQVSSCANTSPDSCSSSYEGGGAVCEISKKLTTGNCPDYVEKGKPPPPCPVTVIESCTVSTKSCVPYDPNACKSVPEILSCLNVPACNAVASGETSCYAGYPNNFATNKGGNWPCFIDNYVDCGCQLGCPPSQVDFSCWGHRGCAPKLGPRIPM